MSLAAPPQDPHAPRFRVRPPANWMNDPNGPFRWRGRYHLFYQHNPDAPVHANVHWGHASSPDLAHWEHHPIALTPVPGGPDEAGCWSGCVVDDGGVPTAVYTGVDRHHEGLGTICLARAADPDDPGLTEWTPVPTPVVTGPPEELDVVMFRDPFVFRHDGRRWALVGAGHADGTPSVLLYDCEDLTDWRFAGVLLDGRDPAAAAAFGDRATGWECPQLYATRGGEWVLVVSLWDGHPWTTGYLTGRLDADLRFTARAGGLLDHGRDFYAPAVLQESDRALMWGWSWEAREQGEADWAGVLTVPRVVDVHPDGALRVAPAPELHRLHAAEPFVTAPGRVPLPAAYDLTVSARRRATVSLLRSASGAELTVRLDPDEGTLTLHRDDWPRKEPGAPVVVHVPPDEELTVRVLADGSLYELFVGDRATVTERVYRRADDVSELTVPPGAAVTGWELVPPTRG
ncbi:glycosyl hydrolase family 32 protein [Streptomyces viridochromogenes DSM 40736]|uniref:beta-fructofuranosidase n=1 Tax=Streptomyces viridochromogenes (strain DSM 40736 / JCM 4977 / BCRC 1201 / Tue 494) TaxID=591159 RepID=D9X5Z3_STRVT|nr:glycoside hydrolase family 32 protein [Streptomyces viridochromogenes]EFL29746.1 glycosyl hydrolase family 32 protein [Streptomyces viridochromogenes DSM 40736]